MQSSDRFLRLFGLKARDIFLIEYRYYGAKWHLVFTFPHPSLEPYSYSMLGYSKALAPSVLSVTLVFYSQEGGVGGELADFYELPD